MRTWKGIQARYVLRDDKIGDPLLFFKQFESSFYFSISNKKFGLDLRSCIWCCIKTAWIPQCDAGTILSDTNMQKGMKCTSLTCIPSTPLIPIPISASWIMPTSFAPSPIPKVVFPVPSLTNLVTWCHITEVNKNKTPCRFIFLEGRNANKIFPFNYDLSYKWYFNLNCQI